MRAPGRAACAVLISALATPCLAETYFIADGASRGWDSVLSSGGHVRAGQELADILVTPKAAPANRNWRQRAEAGAAIVLEGASPLAESFGFRATSATISSLHIVDEHDASIPIVWSEPVEIRRFEVPPTARVFAKERWTGAPVVAGYKVGAGAVLWFAVSPGVSGYERFPYSIQALADLGFAPVVREARLQTFFDYSYRTRADPEYLASHWRAAGVAVLHAAAWHFYEADASRDEYLRRLIEACHRHAILVYAWFELPHVSDRFWDDHPVWREKTGLGQDAQLDWRKLMNMQDPECISAIRAGLRTLMGRFDWDGINLAELYFESLEGISNPARFTPMNGDVRAMFRSDAGWDPSELWTKHADEASRRRFLDFRASLARRMQSQWLDFATGLRATNADLDIVLTHVDDRFDPGMKDAIGADAGAVASMLESKPFWLLIEDPATVWNLGPGRYPEIAGQYAPLTPRHGRLGIDINVVERYQDVYPTKQQTGTELFELVHTAASAFEKVALYFENSIGKIDLPFLGSAAAQVRSLTRTGGVVVIESAHDVRVRWSAQGALMDGNPWPLVTGAEVIVPAGRHTIEPGPEAGGLAVVDINAAVLAVETKAKLLKIKYSGDARTILMLNKRPSSASLDGMPLVVDCRSGGTCPVLLAKGEHTFIGNLDSAIDK